MTLDDLIGETIIKDEENDILKNIIYETEGALVYAAYVETKKNNNFRIKNTGELLKEDFELEVILHLESLLCKG